VTSPSNPAPTPARYHIIARASFLSRSKKHRLQFPYISATVPCRFRPAAPGKKQSGSHTVAPLGECRVSLTRQALIPSSDMTFASS
jgi:hypothetical protein